MKNRSTYQLLSKLFLSSEGDAFVTPERMELLKRVLKTGSMSAGAKDMGKSYKWAWDSIEQMNTLSTQPLVSKSSGGKGGGGAEVTPFARELIDYYDELEKIHQSKIANYEERFNNAFETGNFAYDIASTLHGSVAELVCNGANCEVLIEYGESRLKAKCKKELGLTKAASIAFMVESNQIVIAKQAVEISAQNLLVGEITEITEEGKRVYLTLLLPTEEKLKVLITSDSLSQLELRVGETCFAYFKTYNITILGEKR